MTKFFNTQIVYNQQPSIVDREKAIIRDIVVVQTGEAKGHDVHLDDSFISSVESLGNKNDIGVKARFGHPNICTTALGTYLGRYRNFRKVEDKVLADLYLDKSSIKSPKGNLHDYILDLAESNPDMFGASIAFKSGKEKVLKVEENEKEFSRKFATIKSLYAIDFVDNPAATDGLFNTELAEVVEVFREDDFAYQVTTFLDSNPEIFKLLDSKPEIFESFLSKYKSYVSSKALAAEGEKNKSMNLKEEIQNLKNWVTETLSSKSQPQGFEKEVNDRVSSLETEIESVLSESVSLFVQTDSLKDNITSFSNKLSSVFDDLEIENSGIVFSATYDQKTFENIESAIDTLSLLILSKDGQLAELQTKLNRSLANPTIPDKNPDPLISLENKKNKDITGKIILDNIPSTIRRKLNQ